MVERNWAGNYTYRGRVVRPRSVDELQTLVVSGAATFHTLSQDLHRQGWALATIASLPHISVAGAIATGTQLADAYPMFDRLRQLRDRSDPARKFGNAFLDRVLPMAF